MPRFSPIVLAGIASALFAFVPASGHGQSFNVDFGNLGSVPAASYGAAGAPGQWNNFGLLADYVKVPIVDLAGGTTSARVYMAAADQMLQHDNPGTTGNDGALMDDMLIGFNDPIDVCIWVERLVQTDYEVLVYALTPDDPTRMCRVRVDDGSPGPVMVGGAWPGSHQQGITFERFFVYAAGGYIGFHSGLIGGYFQSGMNGFQIRPMTTASVGGAGPAPGELARSLRISPNPSTGDAVTEFSLAIATMSGRLDIFDVQGRLVWSSGSISIQPEGSTRVRWDGRDQGGRTVPGGVLLARWSDEATGAVIATGKIIRLP